MYARFNHVLGSQENINNLNIAIKNIGLSYNYTFSDQDIQSALNYQLKIAIETNFTGSRYLTSSDLLRTANMHIVMKTVKDLKETYAMTSSVIDNIEIDNVHFVRRKEVSVDRIIEPPRRDDAPIVIRKMTPRELLK